MADKTLAQSPAPSFEAWFQEHYAPDAGGLKEMMRSAYEAHDELIAGLRESFETIQLYPVGDQVAEIAQRAIERIDRS